MRKTFASILAAAAALALASPADARVRAFFTSRGDDLPGAVTGTFAAAERRADEGRDATIDIAVFSFTHFGMADELLRVAVEQPGVQIRIILDLSQLSHSESHVGPYIEDLQTGKWNDACKLRYPSQSTAQRATCRADLQARYDGQLDNVEVKYKWYDGYEWSNTLDRPVLSHSRSLLMHRKVAVVNGDTVVGGSFNWSPQAASSNYENVMVISGTAERDLVDAYRLEFDAMWNDTANFKSGPDCRALRQAIWDALYEEHP